MNQVVESSNSVGFTLLELLVAVAIITIQFPTPLRFGLPLVAG
jgi:hypothetical protein